MNVYDCIDQWKDNIVETTIAVVAHMCVLSTMCGCRRCFQVHSDTDAAGEDLLGHGELRAGGEDLPQVGRVLQRARRVEAQRGARALHAGEQVQGVGRLLRAHRQEALRQCASSQQ